MPHQKMIQTFEVFWMVIAKAYLCDTLPGL